MASLYFRFLAIYCSRPVTDKGRIEGAKLVHGVLSIPVKELERAVLEIARKRHVMIDPLLSNLLPLLADVAAAD
jgi:hypothetical protein